MVNKDQERACKEERECKEKSEMACMRVRG